MATNIGKKFEPPLWLESQKNRLWHEYAQLKLQYNPKCDLGQGYPDYAPMVYVRDILEQAVKEDDFLLHQYARSEGHPRLVNVIAKLYSKLLVREINANTEVLITLGAYEALYSTIVGHITQGDEVIIIEPYFECYELMVKAARGICRFIPLQMQPSANGLASSGDWVLDPKELENIFNEKTKMFILNTPNNPLGKVFTLQELIKIADLCKKGNVLCVSDEVYEWMVFKPNTHIRMASLPGMWERTITIGSAGKTLCVTGWRLGWAYGPPKFMLALKLVHQSCVYTIATPIQEAIAIIFEKELAKFDEEDCLFNRLPRELEAKRNLLVKTCIDVEMKPVIPEAGCFILCDWSPIVPKVDLSSETDEYPDFKFTKWMTKHIGIQALPPSAFYSAPHKHIAANYVRFCFIKKDEQLLKADDILKKWKNNNA